MPWLDVAGEMPYLDVCVCVCDTMLVKGQELHQHHDYKNHQSSYSYTINFGKYEGGHMEMKRGEEW